MIDPNACYLYTDPEMVSPEHTPCHSETIYGRIPKSLASVVGYTPYRIGTPGTPYMSDGSYLRIWKVVFGRTPVCQKHW